MFRSIRLRPHADLIPQPRRHTLGRKLQDDRALGTLEIVLIIAVLIAIALIFREEITEFANSLFERVFNDSILEQVQYDLGE